MQHISNFLFTYIALLYCELGMSAHSFYLMQLRTISGSIMLCFTSNSFRVSAQNLVSCNFELFFTSNSVGVTAYNLMQLHALLYFELI